MFLMSFMTANFKYLLSPLITGKYKSKRGLLQFYIYFYSIFFPLS